jgi:hypothetical protein
MNRNEFTERLQAIGTEEDEAQRRELIAQLMDDAGNDYDDHAAAVTARDQALQQVEDLQAANKRLFLRIGAKTEPDVDPNQKPPEPRKFSDLYNEKGGLK